ncbi:MAG: hypothetical protein AAGH45_11510, partial [Pseudomonadota bacterium]
MNIQPQPGELSDEDFEKELKGFLEEQLLFRGPDPEIMKSHALAPYTEREKEAMATDLDIVSTTVIRNRMQMIANEANEI